jgi:ketopantoate reductase
MRIAAVVGVGVVGSYFGGALARGGEDVVFVARGATSVLVRSW